MHKAKYLILLFVIGKVTMGLAQKPQGRFLTDSVSIGVPVRFVLSYRHKPDLDVFFPDTSHAFKPFQYVSRDFFATQTDARGSLDSVVYTLVSFEINPVQKLQLPVYLRNTRDCTVVYSNADSLFLREMIRTEELGGMKFQSETRLLPLAQETNYPLILLSLIGVFVLAALLNWWFGDTFQRWFLVLKLIRKHAEFVRNFQRFERGVSSKVLTDSVEKAVILWKNYLERLEHKPFTSFTTREIIENIPNESLGESLREIDMTIYGGTTSVKTATSLAVLKEVAEEFYRKKREDIRENRYYEK